MPGDCIAVCSSRGMKKIAKWVGFSLRCEWRKDSKSLAAPATQSKSSAQTYLLILTCVRKLSGSVQRQPGLYDYWDGRKERREEEGRWGASKEEVAAEAVVWQAEGAHHLHPHKRWLSLQTAAVVSLGLFMSFSLLYVICVISQWCWLCRLCGFSSGICPGFCGLHQSFLLGFYYFYLSPDSKL